MRLNALGPFLAVVLIAALGCASAQEAAPAKTADVKLDTEPQQNLYAIGVALSSRVPYMDLTDEEMELVKAGIVDGLSGAEPKVEMTAVAPRLDAFVRDRVTAAGAKEKELGDAWVAEKAGTEGAEKLDSGLVFIGVTPGDGATPTLQDRAKLHYKGTLRDGRVFDSSYKRGEPAEFTVGGVIPCFSEGLQKMKVGGKAMMVCPSDIAYGQNGSPPNIRPGAALMFEVELLDVIPPQAAEVAPQSSPTP